MSMIYDNWGRLVAAVLKREEIWELCHAHSRSPSISSESSDSSSSSWLSDSELTKKEISVKEPVPELVFLGSSSPGFRLKDTLKGIRELGKGTLGTTILNELLQDVNASDLARRTKVVIKLLKEVKVTEEEFKQQMTVLGNCRHENVAAPRGYYFSNKANGKLIVDDYHSRGSISDMLHGSASRKSHLSDWESRFRIAIGAARGIAHIHAQCGGKLVHGNIKSSNIFLNSQQYGCVSDFGLVSMMLKAPERGALGYDGAAYDFTSVSQEMDVYCFGTLLLELLTGKSPSQAQGFEGDLHLVTWVRSIKSEEWISKLFDQCLRRPIRKEKDVIEMMQTEIPGVDLVAEDWKGLRAILRSHFHSMARVPSGYFPAQDLLEMVEMLHTAMRCLAYFPGHRPKMSDVVLMLEGKTGPKLPPSQRPRSS